MIKDLKTKQEAISFYKQNFVYDRTNEQQEKEMLKKYSKKEFQEMYMQVFSKNSLKKSDSKQDLLNKIHYYYDSIERARKI